MGRLVVLLLLLPEVTRGQHRHRQYHYVSEKKNWTEAQAHCKDRFSDLATITDCQENKDAFDTIKEKTNVWIERRSARLGPRRLQKRHHHARLGGPHYTCVLDFWFWVDNAEAYDDGREVTRGQHRHRRYHYVKENKNWTEAQAYCKDRFSDLATITDCQENKDAFDTMKEMTNVWIENAPMILITENRTWEEAVEHCRAEYHDLVSAQSTEALDWVRDVSRNATTPTVWVGLHYTCVLDFWFWVDNAEAYDDGGGSRWADGQRGRGADCGASGAVNISSRLWLSQPSSVKLNFICSLCDKMQT
ncbi:hypothetical protein CRUP_016069 [Coryphaenoides rupestris]|nr:hypothetical protein CRUP_016069 [Coryphaenoides rupestris]